MGGLPPFNMVFNGKCREIYHTHPYIDPIWGMFVRFLRFDDSICRWCRSVWICWTDGPRSLYNLHGVLVVSRRLFRGFRFPDSLLQFRWYDDCSLSRNPGADKPIRWLSMILSNFTMENTLTNPLLQLGAKHQIPKKGQVIQPAMFHRSEKHQMFRSMVFRRKIRMNVTAFLGWYVEAFVKYALKG